MDKYLLPEGDGLRVRDTGKWVKEKLFYVQRYTDAFEIAMRDKKWRRRIFIDLFSGPGKCRTRGTNDYILGSPLIALQTRHPFTDYYFVDADARNTEALQKRCSASNIAMEHIHVWTGDSNTEVKLVAAEIAGFDREFVPNLLPCLSLAFLDPEGLELEWRTVEALAQLNRMDLIIHYSQNGLTRNLALCYETDGETAIDRFFGDRHWRSIYQTRTNRKEGAGIHRTLIDHYKSRLRALGYVAINDSAETNEPLIRNTKRKAPLYRLLFASKHPLGNKIWNEVTKKDVYGQSRLL